MVREVVELAYYVAGADEVRDAPVPGSRTLFGQGRRSDARDACGVDEESGTERAACERIGRRSCGRAAVGAAGWVRTTT